MKLEEIATGASLEGVEPSSVVTVVAAILIPPSSLQLVYRQPDGALRERLISRAEEASLSVATVTRPWSFDGDGAAFQLTAEAKRIDLAFLFDPMMAVHTSNVDPLPHQITAVYESMLPRQPNGNPFEDVDQLIVRLDQVSRTEEMHDKVCAGAWDLVVFDEAHKLSAHFYGQKVERTKRFMLAEKLGAHTRHLLLMTATPHNGKEEDFQLFLSLLDSDRFYGKFRDGVHKTDTSDLMRRMVKEELVKFDNTPLFPQRRAYTVNYKLSDLERALYERVTTYVKEEMGKADALEGQRRGSVGFALTTLQRRLASSPEAIYQSLKRRHTRLERRLREEKSAARGGRLLAETVAVVVDDEDELNAGAQEQLEEKLVDDATAARTIGELEGEVLVLQALEQRALDLVASRQDRKWEELSRILQDDPHMRDASGRLRKLIIFSEHRDTLNYLHQNIAGVLGNQDAIITIHGGTPRDERRRLQALFRADPEVRVLIATDAAGEGVNLHQEVAARRVAHVDKTLAAVHERLSKEIAFWSDRWMKLRDDEKAGKDVRLNLENARRTITDLEGRLENRRRELQTMRHVASATPVALGGALVVPMGLLRELRGEGAGDGAGFSVDAAARKRIELLAMAAVRRAEEARGCRVEDVSPLKCGWDLTAYPAAVEGRQPEARHIEVKGRVKGADTITVTRNEILYALNQAEKFRLAIVLVREDDSTEGPFYVKSPFEAEPGWGVSSINFEVKALLSRAGSN